MELILALALTLLLVCALHRDVALDARRAAWAALHDLRRTLSLDAHARSVAADVGQIELALKHAREAPATRRAEDEALLLDVLHTQARVLTAALRARLRSWSDIVAGLPAAATVEPLRAESLHRLELRLLAHLDALGRYVLHPRWHLRLHLRVLRWGLDPTLNVLLAVRTLGAPHGARALQVAGADLATLTRASVAAYEALLCSLASLPAVTHPALRS